MSGKDDLNSKILRIKKDNPDLSYTQIIEILEAKEEMKNMKFTKFTKRSKKQEILH